MLKKVLVVAVASFAWQALSSVAQSHAPVYIVVAFPPGGPVDFVARLLGQGLGQELGQSVIVENKPGANGAIAAQFVSKSPPDGMTLWLTSAGAAAINPGLYSHLSYDMRDFAPVSLVVNNNEVLVTNVAEPARNTPELVAQSKQRTDPMPIASSGIGSMPHLALELLMSSTKGNFLHVPYKGAAPAINDLLGGQVDGFFGDIPGLIGQIKGGKLRPLGIAAPKRSPVLPDVPTLDEQGIHGVQSNNWYALLAPARTPSARIDALNRAVRKVLATEPFRSRLVESGAEPMPSTPAELATLLKDDTEKWGRIIREKNIKGE